MIKRLFNDGWICNGSAVTLPYDAMIRETRKADNPRTEERFDEGTYTTYYGTALAAVRVRENTAVRVSDGQNETDCAISVGG